MKEIKKQSDLYNKLTAYFQIVAAVIVLLFSLFNLVRTTVQHGSGVFMATFAIMIVAAYCFLKISVKEYKER